MLCCNLGCHGSRHTNAIPEARPPLAQDSLALVGPFEACFERVLPEVRSTRSIAFSHLVRDNLVIGDNYLSFREPHTMLTGPTVASWLAVVDHAKVRVYRAETREAAFFLLSSQVGNATGLAVNMTKWLVANPDSDVVSELSSLSDDPEFFFFRSDSGRQRLNCIVFDYTDDFINSVDRSNLSLGVKAVHFRWVGKEAKVVEKWTVRCSGG